MCDLLFELMNFDYDYVVKCLYLLNLILRIQNVWIVGCVHFYGWTSPRDISILIHDVIVLYFLVSSRVYDLYKI